MQILIMSVVKKVISYVRGSVKVKHKPPSLPNNFDLCSLFKIATAPLQKSRGWLGKGAF